MPKGGHVSFEELAIKFGYSATPGSLHLYAKDENEFREEIRTFTREEVAPIVNEIESEDSYKPVVKIIEEMGKRGY